jgi:hypothetical protein
MIIKFNSIDLTCCQVCGKKLIEADILSVLWFKEKDLPLLEPFKLDGHIKICASYCGPVLSLIRKGIGTNSIYDVPYMRKRL